jgi:outer membrane immunogenic protein
MRRFIGSVSGAVALAIGTAGIASAADLKAPVRKAPPPAAVYNWTGFYIGGHAGYRWMDANATFPSVEPDDDNFFSALGFGLDSFVGGGLVGYNVQVNPNWVVGVEADVSFGRRSQTRDFDFVELDQPVTLKSDWSSSVRGRLGYAWNRTLWYVTGGVAWTRLKVENLNFDFDDGELEEAATQTRTFVGWTVGAGIEHAFAFNWTARLEYLYADYGSKTYFQGLTSATFFPTIVDLDSHTVRAALTYKFGGPIAARY